MALTEDNIKELRQIRDHSNNTLDFFNKVLKTPWGSQLFSDIGQVCVGLATVKLKEDKINLLDKLRTQRCNLIDAWVEVAKTKPEGTIFKQDPDLIPLDKAINDFEEEVFNKYGLIWDSDRFGFFPKEEKTQ